MTLFPTQRDDGRPLPVFSNFNTIAVIVGIVIGIGIFRLPPLIAQQAATDVQFMSFWIAGGIISMAGALCYAELAALKPNAGGEYHFLSEAYGSSLGFLFSWGRMTVIQTGSIALAAFILGDYATLLLDLGPYSSSIYAALTVVLVTGLNMWGTSRSKGVQNIAVSVIVCLLVILVVISFSFESEQASTLFRERVTFPRWESAGSAMIFVLLTYGGWNEAAYLSAEQKDAKKNMAWVLGMGISIIMLLYLLINLAYLYILGLEGLQQTETVGAGFTGQLLGSKGASAVAFIVILTALSTTNASIITGARTNYALGRDFKIFSFLSQWNPERNTPSNALLLQGIIILLLILLGTFTQEAVRTMVDYTAPVFWFFLLLTTLSLFVFRYRYPQQDFPFKVPLYPFIPIFFAAACAYMLYSSVLFTGLGALFGLGVLFTGIPILLINKLIRDPYPDT